MPQARHTDPDALRLLRAQMRARTAGFNPQDIPLIAPAKAEAVIPAQRLSATGLRQQFQRDAHWQPPAALEQPWRGGQLTPSAVLLPIVLRAEPQVLLTQRTSRLSSHAGQIAFPGGRMDAEDANPTACALREAQEEVGLAPQHVEVIGSLPHYATGTAYEITPVIGLVAAEHQLHLNPDEVDSAFEIPLRHLLDPSQHYTQAVENLGELRRWYAIPSYDSQGQARFVWGASAGILRMFYHFLLADAAE